ARFALNHEPLDRELRTLRHQLREGLKPLESVLISSRDAAGDIGADAEGPARAKREDMAGLVTANAKRAQEALRVLEELARLPEMAGAMSGDSYERARFALYDTEKRILSLLWRHDKRQTIRGLYVIIDTESLRGRKAIDVTGQAIRGGARIIQLRDKTLPKGELEKIAQGMKALCKGHGVPFIVNDHLDIALATGADGLHLGQKDMAVATARRLLPADRVIGCSTKTVEQALKAQAEGADYLAVGAIYPTSTKVETVLVGLERLREIKSKASLPVVAIGGINRGNAAEVVEAGADALAVITAVLTPEDAEQAARQMVSVIDRAQRGQSQ
ncbi:MAG: thiamine-phosphate pyrophosphorylase, partial [Dehalococcoidia bacterium]|nr:thiamine-phosphate pyrophosphorylase [Dehalococcoidia bacterium]